MPRGIDAGDAFRIIAASVLRQISSNEPAVRASNPDGIHQMRIGLRRMRAVVSIFAAMLQDAETGRLKLELRWLTGRLGPARDLHLLAQRLRRSRASDPSRRSRLAEVEARRDEAFARAHRALMSPRYRVLLRDLAHWIEAGAWATTSSGDATSRPAADFADKVLAKRARRVMERSTDLRSLDVEERHRLRISAKKLYYATGFFETLISGAKKRDRLADFQLKLKDLLDELGALNDIAVQQRLTGTLSEDGTTTRRPSAAEPSRHDRAKTERLLDSACRVGGELARAKRFWT